MIRPSSLSIVVFVSLMALVSGCRSALGDPPEVEQLTEAGNRVSKPGEAEALRAEAERLLAGFEDVEKARELFLQAAAADASCRECLFGASRSIAWLIEHEGDAARRKELAIEGVQVGQICTHTFPDAPECRYNLALAVGQQARERPSTGADGVDVMVELLEELKIEAPGLDSAGPYRVLALVLLRAPGWPSGPGDPEYGLENALEAVVLFPDYPPNLLVLGEAYLESDHREKGRRAYAKAIELATDLERDGHPQAKEWREEGVEGIERLK